VLSEAAARWDEEEQEWGEEGVGEAAAVGVRLGGAQTPPSGVGVRLAAGAAALQRLERQRQQRQETAVSTAAATAVSTAAAAEAESATAAVAAAAVQGVSSMLIEDSASNAATRGSATSTSSSVIDGSEEEEDEQAAAELERAVQDAGHYDQATAAKERELTALGSMDDAMLDAGGLMEEEERMQEDSRGDGVGGGVRSAAADDVAAADPSIARVGASCDSSARPASPQQQPAVHQLHASPPQERQQQQQQQHQQQPGSPPAAAPPAAAPPAAAVGDDSSDVFSALDSPARRKLSQAREGLQSLHMEVAAAAAAGAAADSSAAAAAAAAASAAMQQCIAALNKALSNLVANPAEQRYQVLKLTNAAVEQRIGRWAAARRLLQLAGFEEGQSEGRPALVWMRKDPGLAWLVLSVVQSAAGGGGASGFS